MSQSAKHDAEVYLSDLGYVQDERFSFDQVARLCAEYAQDAQETHKVDCKRCGKVFLSVDSVEYCSVGCELGYAPGTWWH